MAKFSTPYDTLLRVRRIEEDRAKAELAAANLERRHAQQRLDAARGAYQVATSVSLGETDLSGFAAHAFHAQSAAQAVQWAGVDVEKKDDARALAVEATRAASMRTQGLEKLVDRARQARHDEMLAADQRTAEESMTAKKRGANAPRGTRSPHAAHAEADHHQGAE